MKSTFKHIGWFIKKNWLLYTIALIMLLIVSILPVFPSRYLAYAIDDIVGGTLTKERLTLDMIVILGIPLIDYVINIAYHYILNVLGQNLSYKLREQYIEHLFELDEQIFAKYSKGDLIARVTNDLENISNAATQFLHQIIYYVTTVISAIVMMCLINPILAIASVAFMPPLIYILNKRREKEREYYKLHQSIYGNMTENVLESIEAVKTVRAYGKEEMDYEKTSQAIWDDNNSWWHILKFETLYSPFFELIYALSYTIAIGLGVYYVVHGVISTGELINFLVYVEMIYGPLVGLAGILNTISTMGVSDERYFEVRNLEPSLEPGHNRLNNHFDTITFQDVSFSYDNINVLNHLNFTIKAGETIGIVGPTGCGKTTLVRQLLHQYNVTSGKILIDNLPIESYEIEDIRHLIAYVPQEAVLFRRSVKDNIKMGHLEASDEDVNRAIITADFEKDLAMLPQGSDTNVAELGNSLSGGQKQRLSIARALLKNAAILILDDSLSAVDAITEKNIISHLKENRQHQTTIIIAHRFSAIKGCDKILVLDKGSIRQMGNHESLLQEDGWYKEQASHQEKVNTLSGEHHV